MVKGQLHGMHSGGDSPFSKNSCVRRECPIRQCKLDTAAFKLLGLNKVNDSEVGYDQLENTRQNGDLVKYCTYPSADTMLLVALEKTQQIDDFMTAIADALGLPVREVYLEESVRYLSAVSATKAIFTARTC